MRLEFRIHLRIQLTPDIEKCYLNFEDTTKASSIERLHTHVEGDVNNSYQPSSTSHQLNIVIKHLYLRTHRMQA